MPCCYAEFDLQRRREGKDGTLFHPSSFERSEYDKDWESISMAYNVEATLTSRPTYLMLGEVTDLLCSLRQPGRLLLNLGLSRYEFLFRNLVADSGRAAHAEVSTGRSVMQVIGYAPLELKFKDEEHLARKKVLVNQDVEVDAI